MRVADAGSWGVGPPQWNLSTACASLTAMTTQMASTSDRSGTRLLSETVTNVPGMSSSGDRPRQHGLDFPSSGVITIWEPPRAYKFFVKISACRLNLSTPEGRNVKDKNRILCDCGLSPAGWIDAQKPTKFGTGSASLCS
jgi:hypothetical protein